VKIGTIVKRYLKLILERRNAAGKVTRAEPKALDERSLPMALSVKERDLQYKLKRRPIRLTPMPNNRLPKMNKRTSFEDE
jgi:hypothetical protein